MAIGPRTTLLLALLALLPLVLAACGKGGGGY
jgi:predicted small secreted protein